MLTNYLKPLVCVVLLVLVSACGGSSEDSGSEKAKPTTVNTSPKLSNISTSYRLAENNAVIVEGITVYDAEGSQLTATLSGDDAELFSFNITSGELAFKVAPDYETPLDNDKNSIYNVELTISDGEYSVSTPIEITIINDLRIKIISPVANSNIGGAQTYNVVVKLDNPESDDLTSMSDVQVYINGNLATAIDEFFEYWTFNLENPALADITAEATFSGTSYSDTISVQGLQPLVSVRDIAVDEQAGFLYLNDDGSRTIIKVAIDGSSSQVFFSPNQYGYYWASSILVDNKNNRLLAAVNIPKSDGSIWSVKSLIGIDLTTGEHTILSGELIGSGDLLSINTGQIAFYHESLLIPDYNEQSLVKVDLLTGNRTTLSSDTLGTGPAIERPEGLAVDSTNNLAYISSNSTVIAVDLLTGNRIAIGNTEIGTGTDLVYPDHFFFDSENNRLVFSNETEGITTLNLTTNERIALPTPYQSSSLGLGDNNRFYVFNHSDNSVSSGLLGEDTFDNVIVTKTGQGYQINHNFSLAFAPESQTLFFGGLGVFSFELLGKTVDFWDAEHTDENRETGLALNTDDNSLVVIANTASNEPSLMSISSVDRSRKAITQYNDEDNVNFVNPIDVVLDDSNTYAYVLDGPNYQNIEAEVNIIQVELATGIKKAISNNTNHAGVYFNQSNSIAFHPNSNSLIVLQSPSDEIGVDIIKIDIASGERVLIANDLDKSIMSAVNDALFLADGSLAILSWRSLYRVDLTTGKASILSSNEKGDGVPYSQISSMSYDSINNRIFAIDLEYKGIFAIDISTGNRSLLVSGN